MMVSGEIIAEGDLQGGQPVFTLLDTVRENVSSVPIRLVGGKTVREGRLQVSLFHPIQHYVKCFNATNFINITFRVHFF